VVDEAVLVVSVQMGNSVTLVWMTVFPKRMPDVIVNGIVIHISTSFKSGNEWQIVKVYFCRVLQVVDLISLVVSDTFWV